jgi:hypothetical protein
MSHIHFISIVWRECLHSSGDPLLEIKHEIFHLECQKVSDFEAFQIKNFQLDGKDKKRDI